MNTRSQDNVTVETSGPGPRPVQPSLTRRRVLAATAGLALTARPALGQSATPTASGFTFTDDRGQTVTLPETPQRVVAFSPIAGALWDLGVRPVGVFGPLTGPDGTPDPQVGNLDVEAVTWLGDWDDFDLEQLVALAPDLLVGLELADVPNTLWYIPEAVYPAVADLVPTVGFNLAGGDSVDDLFDRIEELAVALGADLASPEQAQARAGFDAATADLQVALAARPGLSVLVVSADTESLYVANPAWFSDLAFFARQGLTIIAPDTEDRWQILSWEEAGRYQPDLYLIDARGGEISAEFADIPTWQAQPAVQAGQIGPWYAVHPYGRQAFTSIIQSLTNTITAADPDLAP